ncbi:MAG: response regulator transcription factor [Chloroflexi bacterium]|nr:response regulator transcription factor [Chloroflexota bacterium]
MTKIPVFLVDDHTIVREGIQRLLELDDGIEVVGQAGSAEEALDQMEAAEPQVILMDIRLPGVSGIEATRLIKARYPYLRVLVLSAFGHEYLAQAIEAGADGYVLKTAKRDELVAAVKRTAKGQGHIDETLTGGLLGQFAELYKASREQGLSQRQLTVLQRVAQGVPSRDITAELSISDATLKRDVRAVFNYFGVNDRAQAVAEAYKRRIL